MAQEDLIDFKCSNTWLDFYHEQGLTPRKSGENRDLQMLNKKIDVLLELLQKQNESLLQLLEVVLTQQMPKNNYKYENSRNLRDFI